jgi:HD-like signal output (HDOD) protein
MEKHDEIEFIVQHFQPLPVVADRVMYLARQDPIDFRQITKVIETDPALSALIISLANSPLYGSLYRQAQSLNRAIVLLDKNHIIDSVQVYIMENVRNATSGIWPYDDINFWRHSIAVGIVGRLLATSMQVPYV